MTTSPENQPKTENGWHEVLTGTGPMHYRIDGRVGAPWLVFSNSHVTNLSMWTQQVEALAQDFRILRYDQRGHGRTPPLVGPCRFDDLAEDLIAVMDAAAIHSAVLLGVSMGAVTVLRAAARWPDRVISVVAADGQWRSPPNAAEIWQMRIDTARQLGLAALSKPTIDRWFYTDLQKTDETLFEEIRSMIETTSIDGYIGCAQAMQTYDFSSDYPGLRIPVLYVAGARDGALPATMKQMADVTPNSRYVTIPDAGHLPNLEQPALFLSAVIPFLREITSNHGQAQSAIR